MQSTPGRANLDVLRSFAVLAVLFDHTCVMLGIWEDGRWNAISLGTFGVLLFFVHTTLVLMWSLERQPDTRSFYIRRACRIYPLALAVIAVTVALRLPLDPSKHHPFQWVPHDAFNILTNALLVHNLFGQTPVEGVMWTLALEVQMYLVLPILFLFAHKERTRLPFVAICIITALTCIGNLRPFGYSLVSVVPCFVPGVIAYVGFMRQRDRAPAWMFACLIALLGVFYERFPNPLTGWTCCLLLGWLMPFFRDVRSRGLARAGAAVAQYSYSIYLLHPIALVLNYYIHPRSIAAKLMIEISGLLVIVPLGYHFIELPGIAWGKKLVEKRAFREEYACAD